MEIRSELIKYHQEALTAKQATLKGYRSLPDASLPESLSNSSIKLYEKLIDFHQRALDWLKSVS